MEKYTVILKTDDGDEALEGHYFPEQNVCFPLQTWTNIFTFHTGRPEVTDGVGRAWSCDYGHELQAFEEFLSLCHTTGRVPERGEFFSEETQ